MEGPFVPEKAPPESSSPFTHRMPTVSAAQALDDLQSNDGKATKQRWISTGLTGLNAALCGRGPSIDEKAGGAGGVERGKVSEIYGPPGVGKTTLGLQVAANALRAGDRVVWIDAAYTLPGPRIVQILSSSQDDVESLTPSTTAACLSSLTHLTTPTLPHLLAVLLHPSPSCVGPETSLIVIDSLSTSFTSSYPRNVDVTAAPKKSGPGPKQEILQWAASRKWSVLQYLISSLQKLAALRHIAIVILNQTATKMHSGSSAVLVPSIASTAWDAGISARVALFRDWAIKGKEVRLAAVMKAEGAVFGQKGSRGALVAFSIGESGLKESALPDKNALPSTNIVVSPRRPQKRKADEIQDSEEEDDEDYGWADDDEENLPAPPPQWQGSEDILVPGPHEEDHEDSEGEEEEEENDRTDSDLENPGLTPEQFRYRDDDTNGNYEYDYGDV